MTARRSRDRSGGSWGMCLTERVLLPFFGPADVGSQRRRREVSAGERAREEGLRSGFERVVGPDGRAYLVERPAVGEGAEGERAAVDGPDGEGAR